VQQGQGAANQRIAQTREPAGIVLRKLVHVHTNDFNEHKLRKSVQDALAAGTLLVRFGCRQANEAVEQPIGRNGRVAAAPDEARQRIQQRIEGSQVTTEEATDQMRLARAFAPCRQPEGKRIFIRWPLMQFPLWFGAHARFARQGMAIAMRDYSNVAFSETDRFKAIVIDQRNPT
jgi:hypothetical protein